MFKLIVLTALVAVAAAKPSLYASPVVASLVQEKTIESHGNSVVHASAPVVHTVPALAYAAVKAEPLLYHAAPVHLVAEKSVSSHGHSIVHHQPVYSSAAVFAPAYYV